MNDRVTLTLDREDAEWLQRAIELAKHETENAVVESTLTNALTEQRRSMHLSHIWAEDASSPDMVTLTEANGATLDDVVEALLNVTESMMAEAARIEFAEMRTPLHPVISDDDQSHLVFLSARMGLVHRIMNRPPTRSVVTG